jgi:hypothetical protein
MKNGVSTQEIITKLSDLYFKNNCVIYGGHNFQFDIDMFCHQIFKFKPKDFKANFGHRSVDSMSVISLFFGNEGIAQGASLKQTVKALKINMKDITGKYHGALYDCYACFRVLYAVRQVMIDPLVKNKFNELSF